MKAGDVRQLAGADLRQLRVGRGHPEQPVTRRLELVVGHAAGVLDLHGEAAGGAEAADRRRNQRENLRIAQAAECRGRTRGDRVGVVLLALALVKFGKVDERLAGVLASRAQAAAGDGEVGPHILALGTVEEIILDCQLDFTGAGHGRTRRQPELDQRGALVLGRQEPARQAEEQQHQQHDDAGVDREE